MLEISRLPCPVIIPQRRPESRDRGFVRAYAPNLVDSGIDHEHSNEGSLTHCSLPGKFSETDEIEGVSMVRCRARQRRDCWRCSQPYCIGCNDSSASGSQGSSISDPETTVSPNSLELYMRTSSRSTKSDSRLGPTSFSKR